MKISDLKTGMKVVTREGASYLVLLGTGTGDGFVNYNLGTWMDITHFNEYLLCPIAKDCDIMKVFKLPCIYDALNPSSKEWGKVWERVEQPETEEISAQEAMNRLEKLSGKKIKIVSQ